MKKQQQTKRARRQVIGLRISWTDKDPLSKEPNILDGKVSHANPILRLAADSIWSRYRDWITKEQVFLWRIDITVVFEYPNGTQQEEQRRIIARHKLWDIANECEPAIKDAMRHGNNPLHTKFICECLGDREAVEADFEDYEAA